MPGCNGALLPFQAFHFRFHFLVVLLFEYDELLFRAAPKARHLLVADRHEVGERRRFEPLVSG